MSTKHKSLSVLLTAAALATSCSAPGPSTNGVRVGEAQRAAVAGGDSWKYGPLLEEPRWGAGAAVVDGIVYVMGGTGWVPGGAGNAASPLQKSLRALDPATGQWTSKRDMPSVRDGFAAVAHGGYVYVIGGNVSREPYVYASTIDRYDPRTDTWATVATLPEASRGQGVSAAAANGKIYVVGGRDYPGCACDKKVVMEYDPASGAFARKADLPTARAYAGITTVGRLVYVVGGSIHLPSPTSLPTVEVYDTATNKWSARAPLPAALGGLGVANVRGSIYAVGGETLPGTTYVPTTYQYAPEAGTWTERKPLHASRAYHGLVATGGFLYAIGGVQDSTVEVYTPDTDADGVPDPADNCPVFPNPTQAKTGLPTLVIDGNPTRNGRGEIETIGNTLTELGYPYTELAEPEGGITPAQLEGFALVIYDNKGYWWRSERTRDTLHAALRQGKGLFLIGDDMSWGVPDLGKLTHLTSAGYADNGTDAMPSTVHVLTPPSPLLMTAAGPLPDFVYNYDLDHTTATGTGEVVLATTRGGEPTILAYEEPGGGRLVVSVPNIAVAEGAASDAAGLSALLTFFKNAVTWLAPPRCGE